MVRSIFHTAAYIPSHLKHWVASSDNVEPLGDFNRMTQMHKCPRYSYLLSSSCEMVCDSHGYLFSTMDGAECELELAAGTKLYP